LAHTGWVSQMLFNHYEYMQDKEWLRTRAYPFLKKAAEFYANFMDKYQKPNGDIYASMRFEDHTRSSSGFDTDWTDNTNVAVDLVVFRKAFNAAITASEALDVDTDLRQRWIAKLAKVPEIEYGYKEGKAYYAISKGWDTKWPDIDDYLNHVRLSRWGSQAWPVFPGELLDGDEETGLSHILREIMAPIDVDNLDTGTVVNFGIMHGEATLPPYVRMGMIEKFPSIRKVIETHQYPSGLLTPYKRAEGLYPNVNQGPPTSWRIHENAYFASLMTVEMMLQSQSAILRFFPFWDRTKKAKFRGMRAKGGFVVSGEFSPTTGIKAEILSVAGNPCHIRWREATTLSVSQDGKPVTLTQQGRDYVFTTESGKVYRVNDGIKP